MVEELIARLLVRRPYAIQDLDREGVLLRGRFPVPGPGVDRLGEEGISSARNTSLHPTSRGRSCRTSRSASSIAGSPRNTIAVPIRPRGATLTWPPPEDMPRPMPAHDPEDLPR